MDDICVRLPTYWLAFTLNFVAESVCGTFCLDACTRMRLSLFGIAWCTWWSRIDAVLSGLIPNSQYIKGSKYQRRQPLFLVVFFSVNKLVFGLGRRFVTDLQKRLLARSLTAAAEMNSFGKKWNNGHLREKLSWGRLSKVKRVFVLCFVDISKEFTLQSTHRLFFFHQCGNCGCWCV